jgi:hypothetical protein
VVLGSESDTDTYSVILRDGAKSLARRLLGGSLAASLLTAGMIATAGGAQAAEAAPAASFGQHNAPALWLRYNSTPTESELQFAATHYRVAVFNAWETKALKRLKELNPAVTVLVYKDLSSTRSYAVRGGKDDALLPTGVGYAAADKTNPEWFATDTQGRRVAWTPYAGHWQMAVWDASYQQAWAANVTAEVVANGWDGVLADNAMSTLSWYNSNPLAGGRTDADLRAGLGGLIDRAGATLRAQGKSLVPNISDGRLDLSRWSRWASYGGGLEEQFVHWGADDKSGYLDDWGPTGWRDQVAELGAPLGLAVTKASASDARSFRYGLASFWIGGGGNGAFTAVQQDAYDATPWRAEQGVDLGTPTAAARKVGSVWLRPFTHGLAVVNPNKDSAAVQLPAGLVDVNGAPVTSSTLAGHDALVLGTVGLASPDTTSALTVTAADGSTAVTTLGEGASVAPAALSNVSSASLSDGSTGCIVVVKKVTKIKKVTTVKNGKKVTKRVKVTMKKRVCKAASSKASARKANAKKHTAKKAAARPAARKA